MSRIIIPQGNDLILGIYPTREFPFNLDNVIFAKADLDGVIRTIPCELGISEKNNDLLLIGVDGSKVDSGVYTINIYAIVDGSTRKLHLPQQIEFTENEDECNFTQYLRKSSDLEEGDNIPISIITDEQITDIVIDGGDDYKVTE